MKPILIKYIDDRCTKVGFTLGKIYMASGFTTTCYIVPDDNNDEVLELKSRFEPVEQPTMKVKCTQPYYDITLGKVYDVIKECLSANLVLIADDTNTWIWHSMDFFTKVKEQPTMKVMCIEKGDFTHITVGKIYPVLAIESAILLITNDAGANQWHSHDKFKSIPIPEQPTTKVECVIRSVGVTKGKVYSVLDSCTKSRTILICDDRHVEQRYYSDLFKPVSETKPNIVQITDTQQWGVVGLSEDSRLYKLNGNNWELVTSGGTK